jgi:hypothetical protein
MAQEKSYRVEGTAMIGGEWRPYRKVISAPNEKQARERIYTLLGSKAPAVAAGSRPLPGGARRNDLSVVRPPLSSIDLSVPRCK